jgi:putative MATE family efflux protein
MKDLTQGPVARAIMGLSLPLIAGNVFQQLYNTVDSVILGRFVGKTALAASGQSFPVIFLLLALAMGLALGFSVIIAQNFGAGNLERVKKAIGSALALALLAGLGLGALGTALAEPVLGLLGTPPDVFDQAASYLRIIFIGLLPLMGYNMLSAALRGLGDTVSPTIAIVAATSLNIALDLLFIAWLGMGVEGAAWATVLSQCLSCAVAWIALSRKNRSLSVGFKEMRLDRGTTLQAARMGLPAGASQTMVALSVMVLTSLANGYGSSAAAGFAAAGRLDSFASFPAMSIGLALGSFAGQNLGAGREDRARRGLAAALGLGGLIAVAISAVMLLFRAELMALFTEEAGAIEAGAEYLAWVSPFYLLFSSMFITNGLLRGSGASFVPMLSTFVALIAVRTPLAYLLSGLMGRAGVWIAIPSGWSAGCFLAFAYYASGKWKRHVLVRT